MCQGEDAVTEDMIEDYIVVHKVGSEPWADGSMECLTDGSKPLSEVDNDDCGEHDDDRAACRWEFVFAGVGIFWWGWRSDCLRYSSFISKLRKQSGLMISQLRNSP